jgi:hypothetical protein
VVVSAAIAGCAAASVNRQAARAAGTRRIRAASFHGDRPQRW